MAATYKIPHLFKSFSDMVIQLSTDGGLLVIPRKRPLEGESRCFVLIAA